MQAFAAKTSFFVWNEDIKNFVVVLVKVDDDGKRFLLKFFDTQDEADVFGTAHLVEYGNYEIFNTSTGQQVASYRWQSPVYKISAWDFMPRKVSVQ